jgi:Ca-activated chloride channel homolog
VIIARRSTTDCGIDLGEMTFGASRRETTARSLDEKKANKPPPKEVTSVPPGSYDSAADHPALRRPRTMGVVTIEATKMATHRGVRISVVGLVTPTAMPPWTGMAIYLQLDDPTLRNVAQITSGEATECVTPPCGI